MRDSFPLDGKGRDRGAWTSDKSRHPFDPGITAHSIIAVLRDGPITGKTDGVVAHESAHIDGVASELVVRSGHSTQGHPDTVEQVRRILREHIGTR